MYLPTDIEIINQIDVSSIKPYILSIPNNIWEADVRRKINPNFANSFTINLRSSPFSPDNFYHTYDHIHSYKNIEFAKELHRIHSEIENLCNGYIVKSVIIKLDPNKNVEMHLDGDARIFKEGHRFIIPIITNENAYMLYEDRKYHLKEGIIYDTNTFIPHGTFNEGTESRYHMVLDLIFKTNSVNFNNIKIYKPEEKEQFIEIVNKFAPKSYAENFELYKTHVLSNWKELYNEQKINYQMKIDTNTL